MQDYIQALRSKDDTPGSLLSMTRDAEAAILDKYRAEVTAMQQGAVPNPIYMLDIEHLLTKQS